MFWTTIFRPIKGTQTIKDVKNKTMQLRTVLLLSILCILPCCGFPCEYCNLYTKITCYFCYFTFYTKNTLHYIWLWRLLLWKNIIYRRNASRSGFWGQEIFYRVQNISYRDYLTSLTFLNSCQSSLYACPYWNSKIEKFWNGNSTHELHELHPLILLITIMLL